MKKIVISEGVNATVQKTKVRFLTVTFLTAFSMTLIGCSSLSSPTKSPVASGPVDVNESAATVNGKPIKMEEVERGVKQQAQGQESKLSPLELASARLQILEGLIQSEVLYQKAEKEGTVPKDEDVAAEVNKQKTTSGLSAEKFAEQMKLAGMDDASFRDRIKRKIAVDKLIEKITGKIEAPKDSEIDAFYTGNKSAFVNKRGVKLAAIIIDPTNSGEGDVTTNEQEAVLKGNEIIKQLQQGQDFATIAREKSEDQSKLQSGDLGYITEDELKQNFSPEIAATLMNEKFAVGQILPTPMQGKFFIFKLQERKLQDENLTLESPGVREKVIEQLIGSRKQLLSQSYAAIAMNEAKVENYLAQKVVSNPNELSGARPASAEENTNANADANSAAANTNANAANTTPGGNGVKTSPSAASSPKANASK